MFKINVGVWMFGTTFCGKKHCTEHQLEKEENKNCVRVLKIAWYLNYRGFVHPGGTRPRQASSRTLNNRRTSIRAVSTKWTSGIDTWIWTGISCGTNCFSRILYAARINPHKNKSHGSEKWHVPAISQCHWRKISFLDDQKHQHCKWIVEDITLYS